MTTFWLLAPLLVDGPDPKDVKPGWLGFAVFLALAAAVFVLCLSFRKQLRKVDFEEEPTGPDSPAPMQDEAQAGTGAPVDGTAGERHPRA